MHSLSSLLAMSNAGCYIDGHCMNLMYADADDICPLAPTAMEQSLDTCNNYGVANDITFNPLKLVCLVFGLQRISYSSCPRVHIGNA